MHHRLNACIVQGVYDDLEFDGLWIDMNEPSNYCTGDVCFNNGEADSCPGRCIPSTRLSGLHLTLSMKHRQYHAMVPGPHAM